MGLIECASGTSVWHGYYYYKQNKVLSITQIAEDTDSASVAGSSREPYLVKLHIEHPRKSKCNCPRAAGKRIIASIL